MLQAAEDEGLNTSDKRTRRLVKRLDKMGTKQPKAADA